MKIVFEIAKGTVSHRHVPKNFQPADKAIFHHELVRQIPAIALLESTNTLIDPNGRFYRHGMPLSITSFQRQFEPFYNRLRRFVKYWVKRFFVKKIEHISNVVWITDDWSHGYFHWLTETCPVINTMLEHKFFDGYQLALPNKYSQLRFVTESLSVMGIIPLFLAKDTWIKSKKLRTISTAIMPGNYNQRLIVRLREKLQVLSNRPKIRRFFCSRKDADRRKIKNEEDIIGLLTSFQFVPIVFESMSFDEQRSLISSAEWLIGQHGAGLTNMIFMEEGCNLLELRKKDDAGNNCYFSLASALNLNYYYLQCNAEDPEDHNSDLIVSAEELRTFLKTFCS
jgi:capsular polysaccharide biosynthesis protein